MEAPSPLSIPLCMTPTASLLEDDEIRSHLIPMGPEQDSSEELELSSLIHTNPPGSSNSDNTEEPSQNTAAPSADDYGQPATSADETNMPSEMSVQVPSASRPIFSWLSEAGCLVVAIAALTATVVVMAKFDKQEQPHWPYADMLNLSALIAILATLLRSMVTVILETLIGQLKWYRYGRAHPIVHLQVLDEASRGAWGSTKLLYHIHEADWPSISAFFMILSIGIGTFTQLALRTTPCPKAVPHATASIPTANMLFTGDLQSHPSGIGNVYGSTLLSTLDMSIKTAIINGLAGSQSLSTVSASCDTGNCSFPSYGNITHSTLGIESMCVDVSPFLFQTENSTISPDAQFGPLLGTNVTFVWTNYTFLRGYPSIFYLTEGEESWGRGRWYPLISFDLEGWMPFNHPSDFIDRYEISPNLSPQEEYVIKRSFYQRTFMVPTLSPCGKRSAYPLTDEPLQMINTSSCPQLGITNVSTFPGYFSLAAVQCHLYPSIRHYSGSIVNGRIQETLTGDPVPLNYGTNATETGMNYSDHGHDLIYYAFLDPCLVGGTVYTNANISQAPGDRITIRRDDDSEVTGPILCLYGASAGSMWALSEALEYSAFNQISMDGSDMQVCTPNIDYTSMNCLATWWMEPLFNGGNASFDSISAVMSRMADAITNQLRMNGTDWYGNPSNVTGTAFQTVVCTQFQWGWLLFPAIVVLASAVLLIATAWRSSSRWRKLGSDRGGLQVLPVWKSSILPLLFYGLEDGARLKGAPVEKKEMVGLAEGMVARLSFEEDGLRLRSADPAPRE